MIIKNIPKKYSIYSMQFAVFFCIFCIIASVIIYQDPSLIKIELSQTLLISIFIFVIPFICIYSLINFLIGWRQGRNDLKQPNNIEYINLGETKTSFHFYNSDYDFEINNSEIQELKLDAFLYDLRNKFRKTFQICNEHLGLVIYEINMHFELANGSSYKIICSSLSYISVLQYILNDVKNIKKLSCGFEDKEQKQKFDMNLKDYILEDKKSEFSNAFRIIMYSGLFIGFILIVILYIKTGT